MVFPDAVEKSSPELTRMVSCDRVTWTRISLLRICLRISEPYKDAYGRTTDIIRSDDLGKV